MTFKYASEIGQIASCPPISFKRAHKTAFRYIFDGDSVERNFCPVALTEPDRLSGYDDTRKCLCFGLSFFDSDEAAEKKFNNLKKRHPEISKKLGDSLAEVEITYSHGIASAPEKGTGHFTLFEFEKAKWKWKVRKRLV